MTQPESPKRYAQRTSTKRVKTAVVLPPHQVRYLRMIANGSNPRRSVSSVLSELIDETINGKQPPAA